MYRKTILVVDRQPHTRAFIRAVLERRGWRIFEADDEATGWAAVQAANVPLALAVISVESSGPGGQEVSRTIRAIPGVPVLFMSGDAREALIATGHLDESAELLSKPFGVNGLVAAIAVCLADADQHEPVAAELGLYFVST